ncbi:MAG: monovalent cation/H+ antiporter complex subunit F [Pseudomonadota bacterium]
MSLFMSMFLLAAAVLIVLTTAVALARILFKAGDTDRIMAAQLLGTGGVSALLLFGTVNRQDAGVDVALVLAVLTVFAGIAFVQAYRNPPAQENAQDDAR